MKKILIILTIILAFSIAGWEVDNAYADDAAWYDGVLSSGKTAAGKVKIDGYLTAGKLFSVEYATIGNYDKLGLSAEKGTWFVKGEVGILYDFIRPFIGYENLTNAYNQKTFGVDLFLYEAGGVAVGLRNALINTKTVGVAAQNLVYSGALVRF